MSGVWEEPQLSRERCQVQVSAAAEFGRPFDFVKSSPRGLLDCIDDKQWIRIEGALRLPARLTIAICRLFVANRTYAQANGLNVVVDVVALDRLNSLCHFWKQPE